MNRCTVTGCERKHCAKGYCERHYKNYWRTGSPEPAPTRKRTHCRKGHLFTPETTYVRPDTGQRTCRICMQERDRAYKAEYAALRRRQT